MSDVHTQRPPPRGRGASRGGRTSGSFGASSRGGRSSGSTRQNGDSAYDDVPLEEQGEIGQLKIKYKSQLVGLRDMFPDWTDDDLVVPLNEKAGDVDGLAEAIALGAVERWSTATSKKPIADRDRSKTPGATTHDGTSYGRGGARGGRATYDSSRGPRGRGVGGERGAGRGGARGGAPRPASATNGAAAKESIAAAASEVGAPTASAPAWGPKPTKTAEEKPRPESDWDQSGAAGGVFDAESKPAPLPVTSGLADEQIAVTEQAKDLLPVAPMSASEKPAAQSSAPAAAPHKGTWASLMRPVVPPTPPVIKKAPLAPKPAPAPIPTPVIAAVPEVLEAPKPPPVKVEEIDSLPPPPPPTIAKSPMITPALPSFTRPTELEPLPATKQQEMIDRPPTPPTPTPLEVPTIEEPVAPLTEANVDKLEDAAPARPTGSVAATINTPVPTPAPRGLPVYQRAPGSRSGPRRILDQQEAVVMPRDHSIDRAAVQFGSMGLNGEEEEPEEAEPEQIETVAQPPQHSPIGQPKTSLPSTAIGSAPGHPSYTQASHSPFASSTQTLHESLPAPRNAPGLGPPSHLNAQPTPINPPVVTPSLQHQSQSQGYQSQSLPNQSKLVGQHDSKFEPFGQQLSQQSNHIQSPYGYPSHGHSQQQQQQQQQQSQQGSGASAGMPSEYANYYNSDAGRNYNGYYSQPGYGQHQTPQQEHGASQPRATSGLGQSLSGENQPVSTPNASVQQPGLGRFGAAAQGSETGHISPSPSLANAQQAQHGAPHNMQGGYPGYHPAYYNSYMNMYGGQGYPGYNQKGFYQQPYGQAFMSPGYEQAPSPAGFGGYGGPSPQARDSGLSDYGRSSSTQSHQQQQQHSAGGYNSAVPDYMSARGQQGLGGLGSQQQLGFGGGGQGQQGHSTDDLKPFGESKTPSGPSAIPTGPSGRPPSTGPLNSQGGQNQAPPQGQQPPMGGNSYPHHLQGQSHHNGSQSGLGGGQSSHQSSQYGMYGGFAGGYPGSYGSQQQQGQGQGQQGQQQGSGGGRQTGGGGWGYGH